MTAQINRGAAPRQERCGPAAHLDRPARSARALSPSSASIDFLEHDQVRAAIRRARQLVPCAGAVTVVEANEGTAGEQSLAAAVAEGTVIAWARANDQMRQHWPGLHERRAYAMRSPAGERRAEVGYFRYGCSSATNSARILSNSVEYRSVRVLGSGSAAMLSLAYFTYD